MSLHNPNEALAALEGMTITTDDGTSYVRMEDVRRLMTQRKAEEEEAQPEGPTPKTWEQARRAAKAHLLETTPPPAPQLGRAVPAFVSPSAVEGV
jgi:hypothetical protein